jgi:hypothetical protein
VKTKPNATPKTRSTRINTARGSDRVRVKKRTSTATGFCAIKTTRKTAMTMPIMIFTICTFLFFFTIPYSKYYHHPGMAIVGRKNEEGRWFHAMGVPERIN